MTYTKEQALDRLIALEEVTQATGVMTNKTRNQILASLPAETLAEVAHELRQRRVLADALLRKMNKQHESKNPKVNTDVHAAR